MKMTSTVWLTTAALASLTFVDFAPRPADAQEKSWSA
jgi:hypothetical protein